MILKEQKHLLHVFATFGAGGPQVQFCQIANHFGNKYKHTIIAMDNNYEAKDRLRSYLPFECVSLTYKKNQIIQNIRLFRKTLSELKPDLLITYNWGSIEWAMANFLYPICPHIHCEHGFGSDEIQNQFQRRILFRHIFLKRSLIIVPSTTMKKIALNTWKINQKKVLYIPNGIDMSKFHQPRLKSEKIKPLIIGTVAHLRKEKNIPRMIRVFNNLKTDISTELHIIGNGSKYESIHKHVEEFNLTDKVKFLGNIDNPLPILKKFDIFVISSDTEQMPYSVLEAMASSLPIAGTNVGDIKQMVSDPNKNFIVEKNNEWAFTNKLKELITDKNLRISIGKENYKQCIKKYSIEDMFNKFEKIFELIL